MEFKKYPFSCSLCIIVSFIFAAGIFSIGLLNLFATDMLLIDNSISINIYSVLKGISAVCLTAGIIALSLYFSKKVYFWIAAAFILRILFALFWNIEPESDFLLTYKLSELLLNNKNWGDALDAYGTVYNSVWSAHMPFIIYQTVLMKIFGVGFNVLKIANAFWSGLTCIFIYKITEKLFTEKAGGYALVLSAINPCILFFIPVLTNQHISVCFFMASLFAYFCIKNKWSRYILFGVFLAFSQLMRPEMYVVLIAFLLLFLYELKEKRINFYMLISAVIFFACIIGIDTALQKNEVIHNSIMSGNFEYKIAVGLNEESRGSWNSEDEKKLLADELDGLIYERLQNKKLPLFMAGKVFYQFGMFTYPWAMQNDSHSFMSQFVYRRCGSAFMIIMTVLSIITLMFNNERRRILFFVYTVIAGYMAVYMIIEIQSRYNFVIIPLIIILASGSIESALQKNGKFSWRRLTKK